jgi:hypothetical protein
VNALHSYLQRLSVCQGAAACWAAAHVPPTPLSVTKSA